MTLQEYIPFYKRNLKVAFPVMITQAGQVLVQLADNIMVGHLGAGDPGDRTALRKGRRTGRSLGSLQFRRTQHRNGSRTYRHHADSGSLHGPHGPGPGGARPRQGLLLHHRGRIHPDDRLLQRPLLLRGHRQHPQRDVDHHRHQSDQHLPQLGAHIRQPRST